MIFENYILLGTIINKPVDTINKLFFLSFKFSYYFTSSVAFLFNNTFASYLQDLQFHRRYALYYFILS